MEELFAGPVTERIWRSTYFRTLDQTFENMIGSSAQRQFAQAVRKAFDQNSGSPMSLLALCDRFGYKDFQGPEYALALNKVTAEEFFVTEVQLSGLNTRSFRNVDEELVQGALGRPLQRIGKGKYWLTPAEWMTVLNIPGELPLPRTVQSFAEQNGL